MYISIYVRVMLAITCIPIAKRLPGILPDAIASGAILTGNGENSYKNFVQNKFYLK